MPSPVHDNLTWMRISNLKLSCMVGVQNWEQHIPQHLYLDLAFGYQRQTDHSDNIHKVTDYSKIADSICKYCAGRKFHLLESWLDGISGHLFGKYSVCLELQLSLSKPCALENADRVTLSCGYRRSDYDNKQSRS